MFLSAQKMLLYGKCGYFSDQRHLLASSNIKYSLQFISCALNSTETTKNIFFKAFVTSLMYSGYVCHIRMPNGKQIAHMPLYAWWRSEKKNCHNKCKFNRIPNPVQCAKDKRRTVHISVWSKCNKLSILYHTFYDRTLWLSVGVVCDQCFNIFSEKYWILSIHSAGCCFVRLTFLRKWNAIHSTAQPTKLM